MYMYIHMCVYDSPSVCLSQAELERDEVSDVGEHLTHFLVPMSRAGCPVRGAW